MTSAPDTVLVVDFGAQYAQLIARRVREAHVYSEIVPHTMPVAEMVAKKPAAIILSGGPSSVYQAGAPSVDPAVFAAGIPVFGICYGFQAMAQALGGSVARTGLSEFGGTTMSVVEPARCSPASLPTSASGCRTATPCLSPRLGSRSRPSRPVRRSPPSRIATGRSRASSSTLR